MRLPPSPDAPCRIATARDDALTALAQMACVAMALRALDREVGALAATVYERPEDAIAVCTQEAPLVRQRRLDRILGDLRDINEHVSRLADAADLFDGGSLGHVVNRMIVTHAVALLEDFVDKAGQPFLNALKMQRLSRSFRKKCSELKPISDLSAAATYADADLLASIRHVIVHQNGACDATFLKEVTQSRSPLACQLQPLPEGDQVQIPIDDLILPALNGAMGFVQDAADGLLSRCDGPT